LPKVGEKRKEKKRIVDVPFTPSGKECKNASFPLEVEEKKFQNSERKSNY
jgi:hypothetical protein